MIITVNEYPEVTSMVNNDNEKQFWSTFCDYRKLRRTKQYMLNISTIVSKSFLKVWLSSIIVKDWKRIYRKNCLRTVSKTLDLKSCSVYRAGHDTSFTSKHGPFHLVLEKKTDEKFKWSHIITKLGELLYIILIKNPQMRVQQSERSPKCPIS